MGTVSSDDRGLRFWQGKIVKLQAIHRLCNKLMIMLNCWRVNESCIDITTFNPKVKCCVCDKEFGGDECDNLNFMNFKIDSFKIRKNSWLLGTFKIQKIRILNLCMGLSRTISEINKDFSRKKIRFFPPRVFCAPTEGVHWNWVGLSAHLGQKTTIIGLPG